MLNDQDIELLEMHLDGMLDEAQTASLQQRLAAEPQLALELPRLQEARKARLLLWQSFEQPEPDTDAILDTIRRQQAHQAWYVRLLDQRERIAAVAACVAVFLIGWQWGLNANATRLIHGGATAVQPVGLITQQQLPAAAGQPAFEVRVTDGSGKVLRVERFGTYDEAQNFISEIQKQLQDR